MLAAALKLKKCTFHVLHFKVISSPAVMWMLRGRIPDNQPIFSSLPSTTVNTGTLILKYTVATVHGCTVSWRLVFLMNRPSSWGSEKKCVFKRGEGSFLFPSCRLELAVPALRNLFHECQTLQLRRQRQCVLLPLYQANLPPECILRPLWFRLYFSRPCQLQPQTRSDCSPPPFPPAL